VLSCHVDCVCATVLEQAAVPLQLRLGARKKAWFTVTDGVRSVPVCSDDCCARCSFGVAGAGAGRSLNPLLCIKEDIMALSLPSSSSNLLMVRDAARSTVLLMRWQDPHSHQGDFKC
jgi:hypothetical protein